MGTGSKKGTGFGTGTGTGTGSGKGKGDKSTKGGKNIFFSSVDSTFWMAPEIVSNN